MSVFTFTTKIETNSSKQVIAAIAQGDSGGPVYLDHKKSEVEGYRTIVGVNSWGSISSLSDGFTRIDTLAEGVKSVFAQSGQNVSQSMPTFVMNCPKYIESTNKEPYKFHYDSTYKIGYFPILQLKEFESVFHPSDGFIMAVLKSHFKDEKEQSPTDDIFKTIVYDSSEKYSAVIESHDETHVKWKITFPNNNVTYVDCDLNIVPELIQLQKPNWFLFK